MMNLKILQDRIGYTFDRADLLQQAMTHRSYSSQHNERLEFLGDSLLNCVTAINLYERYAGLNEGTLSRLRSSLVRQQALYEIAQHLELSRFLRLGEGEIKAGGARRPSILADAMEALFGAVFLDSGLKTIFSAFGRLRQGRKFSLKVRNIPVPTRKTSITGPQTTPSIASSISPNFSIVYSFNHLFSKPANWLL